jgi:glycosyltransferase involved in cell wall biosynthesis
VRIGIDNISPGQATEKGCPGGMRRYLQSLLTEFSTQRPGYEFYLFTPASSEPLLEETAANIKIVRLPGVPQNKLLRSIYQQTMLAAMIARRQLDVFLATATVAPLLTPVPIVLAVQFLQFYDMPEAYGNLRTGYLRVMLRLSLKKAKRSIIFTDSSKRDLMRHTGIAGEKICVIPHGVSEEFLTPAQPSGALLQLTEGRPYIVYVSATYGYKNHLRLIRAFARLKHKKPFPHVLLLVGSEAGTPFATLRTEAGKAGIEKEVIIAGRLDNIAGAYSGATLAVFPSLSETFGFPILEAMACGCPIVASDRGSMAELAGDAAVLVDPCDEQTIAEGMEQALVDKELRSRMMNRGRMRAAQYTWTRTAAQTLTVLEEAAQIQLRRSNSK